MEACGKLFKEGIDSSRVTMRYVCSIFSSRRGVCLVRRGEVFEMDRK